MKFLMLILFVMFSSVVVSEAQEVYLNSGVDTSIVNYGTVYRLWYNYLHSNPDSLYDNPYWNANGKARYKYFDLLNHQGFLDPSLYGLGLNADILSISKIDGTTYDIRTMFYFIGKDTRKTQVIAIAHVLARKQGNEFKLFNYLPYKTRNWLSKKVDNITYHYPRGYKFKIAKAMKLIAFQDSLTKAFNIKVRPINFYITNSFDDFQKIVGFDFMLSMGSQIGIRGNNDSRNGIIYSGGGGEYYPHELAGIYLNPLFPNANGELLAGLIALYGGSFGHPLKYHYRRANRYLKLHPGINLSDFMSDFSFLDQKTSPVYVMGGLICQLVLAKGGIKELRRFLRLDTRTDAKLYSAIEREFDVSRKGLNKFLRTKIAEMAER